MKSKIICVCVAIFISTVLAPFAFALDATDLAVILAHPKIAEFVDSVAPVSSIKVGSPTSGPVANSLVYPIEIATRVNVTCSVTVLLGPPSMKVIKVMNASCYGIGAAW